MDSCVMCVGMLIWFLEGILVIAANNKVQAHSFVPGENSGRSRNARNFAAGNYLSGNGTANAAQKRRTRIPYPELCYQQCPFERQA